MCVSFIESDQGAKEVFFALESKPGRGFREEARELLNHYDAQCAEYGCTDESELMLRFHLSDIENQAPLLKEELGERSSTLLLSLVGQAPASGARLAMEGWHVVAPEEKRSLDIVDKGEVLNAALRNYQIQLFRCCPEPPGDINSQTRQAFNTLVTALESQNATLEKNCVRTWIYARDIDNNYAGLVKERRELFLDHGMNPDTHFISSTGIEGRSPAPQSLMGMDAISYPGIKREQIQFMYAPEHMSPTALYNVTFERGTRIVFGDRSHYFISGTASIDKYGEVLHLNDVEKQTERMITNIKALLESADGSLSDLRVCAVYLRDTADAPIVKKKLAELLPPGVPHIILRGSVCRPNWLIEMDGVAANNNGNPDFPPFI